MSELFKTFINPAIKVLQFDQHSNNPKWKPCAEQTKDICGYFSTFF